MTHTELNELNELSRSELERRLAACCGSRRWVREMAARHPFESEDDLLAASQEVAAGLGRGDWLEAFSHHPRIGDVDSLAERFGARSGGWSAGEQAALAGAERRVLERLAAANRRYEERFGHLFIVCAAGKSAAEMLGLLEERLGNEAREELEIAAGEQRKITLLRLEKLLGA